MVTSLLGLALAFASATVLATGAAAQANEGETIDLLHYKINAELIPETHTLKARTAVTFKALKPTQSAVFEMNGSLVISSVKAPDGRTELQFIQDRINELNVKINLGQLYAAGSDITLTFDYAGQLATPEGGPIPDLRLAYVGPERAYLFYASRWFPFHGYAADRATSEIRVTAPENWLVAGHSANPVTPVPAYQAMLELSQPPPAVAVQPTPGAATQTTPARPPATPPRKAATAPVVDNNRSAATTTQAAAKPNPNDRRQTFTFVKTEPALIGSFAAGQFINRSINSGGMQIDLYALPGGESRLEEFGKEAAQILQTYNSKFGQYHFGNRFVIAEVDDETLETYSTAGILFLSNRILGNEREIPTARLAREIAYQWWGQGVGLKNFDDAWVSQGLSQYSAVLYSEARQSAAEFQSALAEILELGLAFENEASIARAPSQLNDQSPAYQSIVFYKGAYVYHMLRSTIGDDKFFQTLKEYYATYKGRNGGIEDFEALTSKNAGSSMRGFFSLWVDSTGVPEFSSDYTIIRTREGVFKVRGTVRQTLESFRGPVEVALESEGGRTTKTTVDLRGQSADFELTSEGRPLEIVVDPDNRYMRLSDAIRTSVIVRRGIQHFEREEYAQAEEQFIAAIKVNTRSSWAWYNRGLLYFEQQNWERARDAFTQALAGDLNPSWIQAWAHIYKGNAYDAEGADGRERAVAEYKKAQETGISYNGAQKAVEKYLGQPYKRDRNSRSARQ